jgi:splicing factor 3A subunit 1
VPRETPGGLNEKYNFCGQRIELAADLGDSVRDVKERLRPHLGDIPIKKLKLSTFHLGVMRDTLSLAFYNIKGGDKIAISVKERGGRARR